MKNLSFRNLLLVSSILVLSGCATVDRGNFGPFVKYKNNRSYGYTIIDTSKENLDIPKPPVSVVERFEVRDGDCAADFTDDCVEHRERSEIQVIKRYRNEYDGAERWYTWSLYFPKDYKTVAPGRTVAGQFYQGNMTPTHLLVESNGYRVEKNGYLPTEPIIKDEDLRGKWHTIKVHALWSTDRKKGFFKVYVNDVLKYTDKDKNYPVGAPYFKYGIYRNRLDRYDNKHKWEHYNKLDPNAPKSEYDKVTNMNIVAPTQILYYSNVRKANTEEGLLIK